MTSLFSSRRLPRRAAASILVAAVLCVVAVAVPATAGPGNELYVINQKPASVSVIDPVRWDIVQTIPLDPEPTAAVMDSEGRFLFVLHRGFIRPDGGSKAAQGQLVVYDLASRGRVRTIPLGWNVTDLVFSNDGRYLLCVGEGKRGTKKAPEEFASITVVSARTGEVSAQLPAGRQGLQVALTADASRIFVLSLGDVWKKTKNEPSVLTVFAPDNPRPLATWPLDRASKLALSLDEKWLYVLDAGWPSNKAAEHRNGQVHVFDTATLASAAVHDVGTQPRTLEVNPDDSLSVLAQTSLKEAHGRLYRLRGTEKLEVIDVGAKPRYIRRQSDRNGLFIVSHEDLRFFPDGSGVASSRLVLNPRGGGPESASPVKTLGGIPGELLFLPDQNRAALSVLNGDGSSSKVAILDLKESTIQQVVSTGRGSVKFGKFMGAMALSVALTSLSYGAGAATAGGSPYFFYNVYTITPRAPNVLLAPSADGQFIYALNTQTDDVTVVRVSNGEVLDKIPVGGGCLAVDLAPGGQFVYAYAPGEVSFIDTHTHKKTVAYKAPTGKVHAVFTLDADAAFVALTDQQLVMWSLETGQATRTIGGFGEPFLLLDPRVR